MAAVVVSSGIVCLPTANAQDGSSPITDQDVQYIWPIVIWNVPLKGIRNAPTKKKNQAVPETDAEIIEKLAATAEKGYNRYLKEILPRELEIDKKFAAEYAEADASRVNSGFLRWQKRAYHKLTRLPIEELDWDGKPVPQLPGISYDWAEFFSSDEMTMLTHKVKQTAAGYLKSLGGREKKFRVFPFVEVYKPRDYQRPHMHTGASCSATFFAKSELPGAKLLIEDVRGLNAPFGRTHEIEPKQGELVITPAWASHMIMPNAGNATSVYINFLLWPPSGAPDFDWEDDITGDYIYKKRTKIKAKAPPAKSAKEEL